MRRPDFFIVGAAKSATTAMSSYLRAHPDVFMPEIKELNFFGKDLDRANRPTEAEYLSYFSAAGSSKRAGEASPRYLYSKFAAAEIKQFSPIALIIILLRNPADMMHSFHSQLIRSGFEDVLDFQAALDAEEERKAGRCIPQCANWRRVNFCRDFLYYREMAKYTEQVKRYFDAFGRPNVHVILYDDILRDVAAVYRRTLGFLGVAEDFRPRFQVLNANGSVRSQAFHAFLRNPPAVLCGAAKALLPRLVRRLLAHGLNSLNTRREPRPPMDPELRRRLQAEFLPEVERLSALLGRDLTSWCRSEEGPMGKAA
jgi:hypothetical protein